jgi:integrase
MPMSNDTDVEREMAEAAQDAVASDGPFIPGIERTDINDVSEFGDFEYYAWQRYYDMGKATKTIDEFFCAVSKLEQFVNESDRIDCSANDIDQREAKLFKRWLIDQVEPETTAKYISNLDRMCQLYMSNGYYPGNPFTGLRDTINTGNQNKSSSYQSNERITVDDSRLREAIRSTHGTQKIILLAILLKTGVRISEAINLDWEDIHLDHSLADDLLPEPRFELSDYPDTLYVDSDKTEDTNASTKVSGNKREADTYIPIDSELKRLLIWHALTRERRFDDKNPVLTTNDKPSDKPSDRLSKGTAWDRIRSLAKQYGWWESGRSELRNVTPHWFRAKFSTYISRRLEAAANSSESDFDADPEDIVKGLRGDVGEDVIETYRLREQDYYEYVRSRQFKIGLEGMQ